MGYPYTHPAFVKFRLNLFWISLIRAGILFLLTIIIYLMGSERFSLGLMGLSVVYLILDVVLATDTISSISRARESTHYLIWKDPEELIKEEESITYILLEDKK